MHILPWCNKDTYKINSDVKTDDLLFWRKISNQAFIIFLVEKECKEFDSNILGIIVILRLILEKLELYLELKVLFDTEIVTYLG